MNLYDVIVCGGGTAGACAAIAAGRRGKRVLLIEQLGFLGGSQTGALVLPYMNYRTPTQQLIAGLHQEIIDRLAAWPGGADTAFFNYELLKYVLEEMAVEAGVELRYHTFVSDAITEGSRIAGVVTCSKSGRQEFAARQVIDCTGDADVAFRAGVPCESGRQEDGLNQSASLRFVVGNVDLQALSARLEELDRPSAPPELHMGFAKGHTDAPKIEELIDRGVAEGVWTEAEAVYIQFFSIPGRPGEVAFNCPRVTYINGARAEDLTRVQIEGRRMIPRIIAWCQRYLRGFDDCYLLTTAVLPGIRESRRIVGEHVLTAEECTQPTRFPDRVAKSNYPIDIHSPTGSGVTLKGLAPGEYHDIPYRCLVPLKVDDLLVAGRCISATFEAQAAIRIEPTCRALGEAAGTAAALCLEQGCRPRDLSPNVLLAALGDAGANVWA
ncbi:MAG: FAD-dependent oxidoreductase [Armatimonadetes bacterium]|nr:FAD-dependent oxidoreductase [Armatimonadota bacterium]